MAEYNFDGLVGPTHNYGGLSFGNVASKSHGGQASNPKAAAKQGLTKMRFVSDLGVGQAVLPPQPRPSLRTLRQLGFAGKDEEVLARAATENDQLLRLCSSASSMWTANAATVAPSSDTADGRVHMTPANLTSMFHRALEAQTTTRVLRAIFADETAFVVHDPLPGGEHFADEGAANHTRLYTSAGAVHVFAYGRGTYQSVVATKKFPARQTREASEAIARLHGLDPKRVVFARQHPDGIDAGAFHTDVLAVGNGNFLMLHDLAFAEQSVVLGELKALLGPEFTSAVARDVPVDACVKAYPFNSQLLTLKDGSMAVVAPIDSKENPDAHAFLQSLIGTTPVSAVHYLDVRQSMHNGGGPACLRQRITLTEAERAKITAKVFFDAALHTRLEAWVEKHYRDRLVADDLRDVKLARECMTALDELTQLLSLGSVYDFQRP